MARNIDLSFRPDSYWPESRTPEQLLARIKGTVRRNAARRIFAEQGFAGLSAFLVRDELPDDDRTQWGRIHPACMGGEYLPTARAGQVEIARVSLASVTGDVISIRAARRPTRITYAVVDEYDSAYVPGIRWSRQPLTLGEVIRLIDGTRSEWLAEGGGLVRGFWLRERELDAGPEEAVAFARIESAFYPDLAAHYRVVAAAWIAEQRASEDEDEDEQEHCAGRTSS
jgi:hypothetical protein